MKYLIAVFVLVFLPAVADDVVLVAVKDDTNTWAYDCFWHSEFTWQGEPITSVQVQGMAATTNAEKNSMEKIKTFAKCMNKYLGRDENWKCFVSVERLSKKPIVEAHAAIVGRKGVQAELDKWGVVEKAP